MLVVIAALLAVQDVGVQKVVATIAQVATENAARSKSDRATGDALADLYVRRACESGQPAESIVLGLAYALEPTGIVAVNPLAGSTFKAVERPQDRKARLAAMGKPTLRGREDWLSHFVVSAGLVLMIGEAGSEAIGIRKEVSDAAAKKSGGGTGFSFSDLNADLAGIAFAQWLTGAQTKSAVAACGKSFSGSRFVPDPKGLSEGLTQTEFEAAWGGVEDARFRTELERLRKRVTESKGYEQK